MPFRPALNAPALAGAFACALLLTACGGGSGSAPTSTPQSVLGQDEATADAANGAQSGASGASTLDSVYDTTQALAANSAALAAGARSSALSAAHPEGTSGTVIDCAGGGTATLTVTGGTGAVFEPGEQYTLSYAQCTGGLGLAQLDGSVTLAVVSVSAGADPVTTADITLSNLAVTTALGTATLNGSATLARSATSSGTTTTTTSVITASSLDLTTAFNGRSGQFTLGNVDWTRTVETDAGIVTGSQFIGQHTLSGSADGFSFSQSVSTTGGITYDASGTPSAGTWTTVRPDSTLTTTIASGTVTLQLDVGNNGTIDRTWTFPIAQLTAAAG